MDAILSDSRLRDIADGIRSRTGGVETYTPAQMGAAIRQATKSGLHIWKKQKRDGGGGVDGNTLLMLHGEKIEDSSSNNTSIINVGVTVSAAQSKFGPKSLYFDGSKHYLQAAEYDFKTSDFTIDWWEYPTQHVDGAYSWAVSSAPDFLWWHNKGNELLWYANTFNGSTVGQIIANQWTHRAFVRKGNIYTAYQNGTKTFAGNMAGAAPFLPGYKMYIGAREQNGNVQDVTFKGYMDEFRISNVARWTSNFKPPTLPYSDLSLVGYVLAQDPSRFPADGEQDGYWYTSYDAPASRPKDGTEVLF